MQGVKGEGNCPLCCITNYLSQSVMLFQDLASPTPWWGLKKTRASSLVSAVSCSKELLTWQNPTTPSAKSRCLIWKSTTKRYFWLLYYTKNFVETCWCGAFYCKKSYCKNRSEMFFFVIYDKIQFRAHVLLFIIL